MNIIRTQHTYRTNMPIIFLLSSPDSLAVQLMVGGEEIFAFYNQRPRNHLESDDRPAVHGRCQRLAPWQKADHFIPQLYDGNHSTYLISEPVFGLKSIPAVFHHYFGKLPLEVMAADSESIGQDADAVKDKDLFEVHRAVSEELFDCART
jgi:hypothetical protein